MKGKLGKRLIKSLLPSTKPYEIYDVETRGLLLRVQPSGEMVYYYTWRRPNGKRARMKIGSAADTSPVQARDKAMEHRASLLQDVDPAEEKRRAKAESLGAFIDGPYRMAIEAKGLRTRAEKLTRLKSAFKDFLDLPMTEITEWRIQKWRGERARKAREGNGKPSGATINRDVAYLKACLNLAVRIGLLKDNPLRHVRPDSTHETERERYLSPEEEVRLMAALDAREEGIRAARDADNAWRSNRGLKTRPDLRAVAFADYIKPLILVALHTGCRRGELYAMTWADLDLTKGVLTVRREHSKSKKARRVPLNATARRTLEAWRAQTAGDGYVFEALGGGPVKDIYRPWRQLMKEANILDFKFHDLRHTCASRMVQRGVDLYVVQRVLGHSVLAMTQRYSHLADQQMAAALAVLDDEPENIIPLAGRSANSA